MQIDHVHTHAHDAGEQAASLRDWDQHYEQLSAGRFQGEVDELQVGPVQVFVERANQTVLQAGRVRANRASIALVRTRTAPGWCAGHVLEGDSFIGISSRDEFDLLAGADTQILAIAVDRVALNQLVEQLDGPDGERPPRFPELLKAPPGTCGGYAAIVEDAMALARRPEGVATHAASRRMLALSLCDAMLSSVRSAEPATPPGLSAANRLRIVSRARAYMQDRAHEVIAVPDLCKAIGTSRRALQYAFEDVMQISPVTYLRAMRLNRVRHELRHNTTDSVGDVAARWGFWHPSRFASEYKALFGELPSSTRASAGARSG